jgi:cysteine desulfurase/selenocysteine lyase
MVSALKMNKPDSIDNPWRSDFLIFADQEKPVAFMDSAASAQKPDAVINAMNNVMQGHYANIHRGLYDFSQKTTALYEEARHKVAQFIGASSDNEVVFTRNATEAVNLVAQSWGKANLNAGDEVMITEMEHHANIVPWQLLADQIGIVIKVIPLHDDATLDYEAFEKMLSSKTKLLSFVHISNATGVINDAEALIKTTRNFNPEIKILVDGSQSIVHKTINVSTLGADFFVFTGHKLYGPSGVGVLWGREALLNTMPPYQGGGDMIETVSFKSGITYKQAPARFEAGTPAIIEVIGLGAAIDYISDIGVARIEDYESELYAYMRTQIDQIEGLTLYGDVANSAPVLSFTVSWAHISDVATILDQCGVAVRSGHHCAMPLMERLGIDGSIRASIGLYNSKADIDQFINALKKAYKFLG